MKIVAGKYGGRRLIVPKNRDIRPTGDKVRGAIFNMLSSRGAIEGAHVLDAFCGTGALGLEALSRGAETCEFIDKSRTSLALARENAGILGEQESVTYTLGDAGKVIKSRYRCESAQSVSCGEETNSGTKKSEGRAYSLVFLDPPYEKGLIASTLCALKDVNCLYENAWVVCESERNLSYNDVDGFYLDHEKEYGITKVALLQYRG